METIQRGADIVYARDKYKYSFPSANAHPLYNYKYRYKYSPLYTFINMVTDTFLVEV
jgi:hypothetical protein